MRREVLQQRGQRALHVVGLHRAHAARPGVRGHPAQLVQPDLDPGEFGHHLRARDEGDRLGVHDDQIGQPQQQGRPRDDRAGRRHQHGHDAATGRDGGRGLAPAVERRHAVEHVGPARGHDEHERYAEAAGQIGRFRQTQPVGVGEGAPPLQRVRPGHHHVAATHAADARIDGAGDALADADAIGHTSIQRESHCG